MKALYTLNKRLLSSSSSSLTSNLASCQILKEYDGSAIFNKFESEILLKSTLSPSNVFITNSLQPLCNLVDNSFKDIDKYPDIPNAIRLNEKIPSRFRKIRFIDGTQRIYGISPVTKLNNKLSFDYNELELNFSDQTGYVQDVPTDPNVNNFRGEKPRCYQLIENDILLHPVFLDWLNYISLFGVSDFMYNYVNEYYYNNKINLSDCFEYEFEINLHFMRVKVSSENDDNRLVSNSPEGIHQDGDCMTFIGPVVNRYNVDGGYSIVYDLNKCQLGDKFIMNKGQGLLIDDRTYYHYVTEVKYSPQNDPNDVTGYRDIVAGGLSFKDPKLNRWNKVSQT